MSPGRRAVTRDDVARQAGVSSAVVSYVVNNGPKPVAPTTAARVRDAIELLDYRPNPSAKALRKGRTDIVGLVLADADNPFYTEYASAIGAEAYQRGRALMIATARHDLESETRLVDDLLGRQVDGIIAASVSHQPEESFLRSYRLPPIVLLDAQRAVPGFAGVGLDGAQGARLAVEHLVGVHGHRRIGIALGDAAHDGGDPRETGWRQALHDAGLPAGPVARVAWTREGGYEAGRLLLESPEPPTAVFACSDLLAVGLLRAGHERGLALPGDLAVVSFDGTKEAEYSWPPLTVVAQPIAEMARVAVSLALDPARPTPYTQFPGTLVVRRSCGCPVG
ncbi:MAG TPA: LacI family DNA-binding transcriptional regulator [Friedmanniella sp.]